MPDINYSLTDALAELERIRLSLKDDMDRKYTRVMTQLHQAQVARQQVDELALQFKASAIGVVEVVIHPGGGGDSFEIQNGHGYPSETCRLIRPLKEGRYRAVVIFTAAESPPETAK